MTATNDVQRRQPALVPAWSVALAVAAFLVVEVLFVYAFARFETNPPHLALQLVIGAFTGLLVAMVMLGAGYVNRDAKRRGMNALLWTALVIFIPNAIGFILYFFVRTPVAVRCDRCGATTRPGSHYCSTCGSPLTRVCHRCGQALAEADAYCQNCGEKRQARP